MNRIIGTIMAAGLVVLAAQPAAAQSKTIMGEAKTETATIEAIEVSSRTLTLKKADGTYVTTKAPAEMKRFSELKIGDKVTARYYENVVVRLKAPGEKDVDTGGSSVTRAPGAMAATQAEQRTITATITAIDQAIPSITFTGPNGWKYSSKVQDKAALAKVKVGDKVDIVWTEAILLAAETPK